MRVLLDTNVLVDVLTRRQPFSENSARVWALAEAAQVEGFVSALTLPNLFYLLRKSEGKIIARRAVRTVRDVFQLVPLDEQIVHQALDAEIVDFEDAVQFFSALRARAAVLITRNTKDFPATDVAVQTPEEFLATHFPAE